MVDWMSNEPCTRGRTKALGAENHSLCWTPRRKSLLSWFRTNAEPLADAYAGAVRLISDPTFPGRVNFIAHAVRDIADRLAFVLDPLLDGNRVQYANELDQIERMWHPSPMVEGGAIAPARDDTVAIEYRLAVRIDALVSAHRRWRQGPSNYELLFHTLMQNEPSQGDVNERIVSDFKKVRGWFMSVAHFCAKTSSPIDEEELQAHFRKFETMLHSFVGDFFIGKAEIDEILQQANQ